MKAMYYAMSSHAIHKLLNPIICINFMERLIFGDLLKCLFTLMRLKKGHLKASVYGIMCVML